MDKKEKINMLSEKLLGILPLVDSFMESLDEEDFELLKEVRDSLENRISTNNSAMVLIYACGGTYDDTEDTLKLKTLDCLIDLLNIRKEYKEEKIKELETKKNKQDVLKLFGLMGM